MLSLSGWDSGLVFSRRVRYRLVRVFSIPADSPRDKRGIVWSGNRGLRFGIGADNGRLEAPISTAFDVTTVFHGMGLVEMLHEFGGGAYEDTRWLTGSRDYTRFSIFAI
jgi:hypothetical protein